MAVISPTITTTATSQLITLAAGCFWGVEKIFLKQFANKGLVDIKVGYANGKPNYPDVTYPQVCSGNTNFAEAVQLSYEPDVLKVDEILDIFFRMHDPTTLNRQGADIGTQYRSVVMAHDNNDLVIAEKVRNRIQTEYYPHNKIITYIEPVNVWFDAEEYHQKYLVKNPEGYECPSHYIRTKPKAFK